MISRSYLEGEIITNWQGEIESALSLYNSSIENLGNIQKRVNSIISDDEIVKIMFSGGVVQNFTVNYATQ